MSIMQVSIFVPVNNLTAQVKLQSISCFMPYTNNGFVTYNYLE